MLRAYYHPLRLHLPRPTVARTTPPHPPVAPLEAVKHVGRRHVREPVRQAQAGRRAPIGLHVVCQGTVEHPARNRARCLTGGAKVKAVVRVVVLLIHKARQFGVVFVLRVASAGAARDATVLKKRALCWNNLFSNSVKKTGVLVVQLV